MRAACNGHEDTVKLLVNAGADIRIKDNVSEGCDDEVRSLLSAC